jgi:hypothetical protein
VGPTHFGVGKRHLQRLLDPSPQKMLATFPSRVFLAPSSSNRCRAQLLAPHPQPAPFSLARRSQADRAFPSPSLMLLSMLLPRPAVGEGGGLCGAGGWSLLSSDVGIDGSSAFDSFLLPSPTDDDDDAGTEDEDDEAEAAESDGGDSKGAVLMGGSTRRGSSLHAPAREPLSGMRRRRENTWCCGLAERLRSLRVHLRTVGEATMVT